MNAGSLDAALAARDDLTLPEKLAASALDYVRHFEDRGFRDLVVSAKAHDVRTTIATYRQLARELPHVPLHIGVTEAGTAFQGVVKSPAAWASFWRRASATRCASRSPTTPSTEVRACWTLLAALDVRRRGPELISCPTCGRCQVDLIGLARQVEERLADVRKPLKVAVMGCVVNGPGEAADADIGVACGDGSGVVFSQGNVVRKVAGEATSWTLLMEEIGKL